MFSAQGKDKDFRVVTFKASVSLIEEVNIIASCESAVTFARRCVFVAACVSGCVWCPERMYAGTALEFEPHPLECGFN